MFLSLNISFLTGAARGVTGHTGGPYDTVPEVVILESLFTHSDNFVPIHFDEAGTLLSVM